MLAARKYVALCFVLHHFGHDKATSVEQNTDKRYINARAYLQQLCSRYRPPEKMNWLDNADVCEKLNVSKRTLQTYRDSGRLAYSQINHKLYYRLEDVEAFLTAMSKELIEDE